MSRAPLGLFYNGNNPLNLRDGYGPSDFDRTHVFNIDYHYELPKFVHGQFLGREGGGWLGHSGCRHHSERAAL